MVVPDEKMSLFVCDQASFSFCFVLDDTRPAGSRKQEELGA